MTLVQAVAKYVDYNQAIGMRFQVDAGMLRAFHRQTGDVDLVAVSADMVAAFFAASPPSNVHVADEASRAPPLLPPLDCPRGGHAVAGADRRPAGGRRLRAAHL